MVIQIICFVVRANAFVEDRGVYSADCNVDVIYSVGDSIYGDVDCKRVE